MDIVEKARQEILTFERPSKVTSETLVEEIDRLRVENEHLAATACIHLWSLDAASDHDTAICGYDKLRAENEVLRADAERYRAIRQYLEVRQHAGIWWLGETNNIGHGAFSSIDSAIDALRLENEALITQRDAAWVAAIDAALSAVARLPVSGRDTAHDANHAAWVAIRALRGEGEKYCVEKDV